MQHDFSFLRKQSLRNLARLAGHQEEIAEEAFDVFIQARNRIDLHPDVLPALKRLSRRFRLSTASNGNADLRLVGIAQWFERSISAREVGALKPDPAIFRKVVEGTDLGLAEVLYVGDDPALDIVGARGAGMHTAWMNRAGSPWPEAFAPADLVVGTLTELVERLGC